MSIHAAALDAMMRVEGFDVVVVCTGTAHQAAYWQARLERGKGVIVPANCIVLCVHEDWNGGGAGNALGTLYAWRKACALAASLGVAADLVKALRRGEISAALYHTAGKGTRLAPLPGAENNNKPGVKLPCIAPLGDDGAPAPLTILEAVVKQTGVYAAARRGRLSVFWGDQIFVPTRPTSEAATAHADILCMLAPMPSAEDWAKRGLEKYGLVAVAQGGGAAQIEKVSHATAVAMTGSLGEITAVGTSLGSFSVDAALLETLDAEFAPELEKKQGSFDTDPHWWMPMTLPAEAYCTLMAKKNVPANVASAHHARIAAMLSKFPRSMHLLGPVDIGADAYWWDYGQLKLYLVNATRLVEEGVEAEAMRTFLGAKRASATLPASVECDAHSCADASRVAAGSVTKSVLANVACERVEACGCVLVNVTARKIVAARGSIAYNVCDDTAEGLVLAEGDVVTDVYLPDGSVLRQRSNLSIDGGDCWKSAVLQNQHSFEKVYNLNVESDVDQMSRAAIAAHTKLANTFALP